MICPFIESAFYYEKDKKDKGNAVFGCNVLFWHAVHVQERNNRLDPQCRQSAVTLDSVAQTEVKVELSSDYIMNGVDHSCIWDIRKQFIWRDSSSGKLIPLSIQ